tara:strand:+ start:4713 stop:5798 length:1086 start_codon:yes stop_codon:yes gene_type:complete
MEDQFEEFETRIRKSHRFGLTPKFKEYTKTNLKKRLFVAIAVKAFEKLHWDIVFQDETSVEAKRKGSWDRWTEKITATFEYGKVTVESISLGNEMWDNGRNSKRVRLFIHAFELTEKELDKGALEELENELDREDNWDNYVLPESLPAPPKQLNPQLVFPMVGGIVISLITGFIIAFLTYQSTYFIGAFEVGAALLIAFSFKYLIRLGNYTNFQILQYILGGVVLLTYISNQYFYFELIWNTNNYEPISFLEFIKLRIKAGLEIKSLDTGWIGLVISWIFQLGITYIIVYLRVISSLTVYLLERVPIEVSEFTLFHLIKGKSEDHVRLELTKMGWGTQQSQNEALESIAGMQNAQELDRME